MEQPPFEPPVRSGPSPDATRPSRRNPAPHRKIRQSRSIRAWSSVVAGMLAVTAVAIAAAAAAEPPRRVINLPGRTDAAPYSDAILAGDTLYLAGRLGLDPVTNRPPANAADEARLILDGMRTVLAEAGMTMDDLVSVQVFCADVGLLDTFNAVYRSYFSKGFPARAFIGSGPLLFGARFEVQAVAVQR